MMYDADGHEMARQFYTPVLGLAKEYDRVSGYFNVDSLVVVAAGLAGLMEIVVGSGLWLVFMFLWLFGVCASLGG
jgi:fatty acid desaturase